MILLLSRLFKFRIKIVSDLDFLKNSHLTGIYLFKDNFNWIFALLKYICCGIFIIHTTIIDWSSKLQPS